MSFRTRPLVRRLAAALAAAQIAAYAAAPILESRVERAPGPVSVEQGHSSHCVKVHQAATCLACQLVVTRARAGEGGHVPELAAMQELPAVASEAARAPRAPPDRPQTRAPPSLAA